MWTPSRGLGSGRRAGLRRIADYIGDDHTDASDNESFITSHSDELLASTSAAGGMLPAFLADQSDLVEVMLELDEESMVGLRFISRATGSTEATALWGAVEERFDALSRDGLLARDDFGDCIGMVDSKEFAVGIFDALARRRRQNLQRVTKEELRDFWLQISDQSFDARLQIFFDMVDTNVDGRITREEVQELIVLSASANKLSKLKEQAEEYALLIMEELDPEGLGYIELLTWMYIAVPFALHVGERTLRALRSKAYAAKILKVRIIVLEFYNYYFYINQDIVMWMGVVCLLPGNVLTITMSKPYGFRYRSGQYVFLQCPTISPFEWHPFSITSAPGDDYISVHIQTRGDWTQELKHIFVENYFSPCLPSRASFGELGMPEQKSPPRLLVDGPYGAPAQDFRNYDVLLLVGLGIGATPFISILRDLLNNIKLADELMDLSMETSRSEDSSNTFSVSTASSNKRRAYRTSRAHFYWVTREPGSFEWFKSVMDEVAEMDKKGVIELHNYLTSVYEERDARTTLLSMVQALNHAKNGIDIVSGTRVRTHFARPNWREEFTRISAKHPGVFYCGKPTLAKELKKLSLEMSRKTMTRFHFHKEYF
uniref:Respiratory burst oxidase-E-like protein n=1 Tax=Aegilops tauschii TaxID=37682 RepID=R7WA40_AEGTA